MNERHVVEYYDDVWGCRYTPIEGRPRGGRVTFFCHKWRKSINEGLEKRV
jgi:hypothetical protein